MAKAQTTEAPAEEPKVIRPKDLADALGISPKTLRAYLRRNFPRAAEQKNTNWAIPEPMAAQVVEAYKKDQSDATADDAS